MDNMGIICVILAVISCALIGACIWLWVKYKDEKDRKWYEISRNLTLEKELAKECEILLENMRIRDENAEIAVRHMAKELELQNKLSAITCPTNNHVWDYVDGVKRCRKCGAVRYGQN